MKKITLFAAALCLSTMGFSQLQLSNLGNSDAVFLNGYNGNEGSTAPCSKEEVSNNFENGFGNTNLGTEVADDFLVDANQTFLLEKFTLNLINNGGYNDINVAIYEDNGGFPGNQIFSETIIPTSSTVIGAAFGRDVNQIEIDFSPAIELVGDVNDQTRYWISVVTPNPIDPNTDSFWETTTASSSTVLSAFRDASDPANPSPWMNQFDDGMGNILDMPPATVFLLEGECESLSTNDYVLSQVSVYPNPASDVINLKAPASIEIQGAILYDVLGKQVNNTIVSGVMNISDLARGVYMLQVKTSAGTLTQKVIKR